MSTFTKLELGALNAIFAETREYESELTRQLENASVVDRENTGAGFFTTISVSPKIAGIESPRVLGHETNASVEGLIHGMGFVLFIDEGRLNLLEGYAFGAEDTTSLNLEKVNFIIGNLPDA